MTEQEVLEVFERCGALLSGHFLLTSGRHSDRYIEKFRVLERPELTSKLCAEIARRFEGEGITVILGPATGGVILAFEVARQLGCRAMFCEREEGKMSLRRGFELKLEDRVLVVDDVVTTGGSLQEVVDVVRRCGANLVGVALLTQRGGGVLNFGVNTEVLLRLPLKSYAPEECPLCKKGLPLQKPGSRYL